jgi:hypothetical protein
MNSIAPIEIESNTPTRIGIGYNRGIKKPGGNPSSLILSRSSISNSIMD